MANNAFKDACQWLAIAMLAAGAAYWCPSSNAQDVDSYWAPHRDQRVTPQKKQERIESSQIKWGGSARRKSASKYVEGQVRQVLATEALEPPPGSADELARSNSLRPSPESVELLPPPIDGMPIDGMPIERVGSIVSDGSESIAVPPSHQILRAPSVSKGRSPSWLPHHSRGIENWQSAEALGDGGGDHQALGHGTPGRRVLDTEGLSPGALTARAFGVGGSNPEHLPTPPLHGPGLYGAPNKLNSRWIPGPVQPKTAVIPNARAKSVWKQPYSYGYFGSSGSRHWSKHHGYRDRTTEWRFR